MAANMLSPRHIQNMSEATDLQRHWGYADRAVPCTNDPGSCAYLDVVYHSHDLGMLYCGIIWATIGGILLVWAVARHCFQQPVQIHSELVKAEGEVTHKKDSITRLKDSVASSCRRYLLPESLRPVFGRTTRLQVLILLVLVGYLTVLSFVGIEYHKWTTPVKNMPGVNNTRTSLGPWADRVGVLAYALTPLSVMLSSRESLLSIITGIPYQHFNFLHRWLGYIIFIQAALHTIGWCIIEIRLYQPQPSVGIEWISQKYMIWGVIAMFFLTVLFALSTPWAIRRTGYEFFRKCHYVMAMLYIGACWGHWSKLNCYLIPSLVIWFIDRGARFARMAMAHYNYLPNGIVGFRAASATITRFVDPAGEDVVRLDFMHPGDPWNVGQHFYLCLPQISIWQSHPFTPLSLPTLQAGSTSHSYIIRAKKGATRTLADLAAVKESNSAGYEEKAAGEAATLAITPVLLTGPYGESITDGLSAETNILCIAGGTGVTYVLPALLGLLTSAPVRDRRVDLIWAIRRCADVAWIQDELDQLRRSASAYNLSVRIFVTREHHVHAEARTLKPGNADEIQASTTASSSSSHSPERVYEEKCPSVSASVAKHPSHLLSHYAEPQFQRPELTAAVQDFVASTVRGSTTVYASGPVSMITELREVVAQCNSGGEVWRGNERFDVRLVCDDRLEW